MRRVQSTQRLNTTWGAFPPPSQKKRSRSVDRFRVGPVFPAPLSTVSTVSRVNAQLKLLTIPSVWVVGTGGTIASKAASEQELTHYQNAVYGSEQLLNALPAELRQNYRLHSIQPMQKASEDLI